MQPFKLQLLGTFLLATPDVPQGVRMGRKAQAFLAVVTAHGIQGISRPRLLSLLWDRRSEDDARNALRQTLHQVRLAMGVSADRLQTQGDRVCLSADPQAVDLWHFEQLANQTDTREMGLAAQLYRGDFAQGLEVGGIDIQRWIGHTQERVREVAQNLLMRMATRGEAECFDAGIDLGRRLLTSDPSHEGCYRALMLLYSRRGLGSKALRIWDECRQVLRKDLNVAPSAETAALAEKLRLTLPLVSPPSSTHTIDSLLSDTMANTASRENAFPRKNDGLGYDHLLRGWQLFSQYTAEANPRARAAFEAVVHNEP
ncbi:MAG: hypothetical protein K9K38_11625, partial [Rhodoferax sp.]|nr:hypothetical protein [Rhodoferax sp.]